MSFDKQAARARCEAAKTLMAESDRHNQIFAWDAAGNPTSVAEEWGPLVEAMPCLCAALAALSRPKGEG
jgi:hypothetical protein